MSLFVSNLIFIFTAGESRDQTSEHKERTRRRTRSAILRNAHFNRDLSGQPAQWQTQRGQHPERNHAPHRPHRSYLAQLNHIFVLLAPLLISALIYVNQQLLSQPNQHPPTPQTTTTTTTTTTIPAAPTLSTFPPEKGKTRRILAPISNNNQANRQHRFPLQHPTNRLRARKHIQ